MNKVTELYISCDVETDGPVPGLNSMLSLGAAAIGWDDVKKQWEQSHRFSANLVNLHGANMDGSTWKFWQANPEAYAAATENQIEAWEAMTAFQNWLKEVRADWNRRPVAVGAPAVFDLAFVRYYMIRFLGTDAPFGHSGYDTKSVAATLLKQDYYDSGKSSYPKEWFDDNHKHTHIAVEDAIEQAYIWSHIVDASEAYYRRAKFEPKIPIQPPPRKSTHLRMQ